MGLNLFPVFLSGKKNMKTKTYKKVFAKYLKVGIRTIRKSYKFVVHKNQYSRLAKKYAGMEAKKALRLFYTEASFHISVRPRVKLFSKLVLILILTFVVSSEALTYLKPKEAEIKLNGKSVLVAQEADNGDEAVIFVEQEIGYKMSPFDFKFPVSDGQLSQGYSRYHRAYDIAVPMGAAIAPLGDGRVEFAGKVVDGKGTVVVIDHGDGLKSLYAHMGKIYVGVGNEVTSDDVIGTVGMTGRTTGPHVHLEIYDSGIAVNPGSVLPN